MSAKQDDASLKVLEPLLTDDQKDPDILSLASQAYEATKNTPKAVELLRKAIVLSPATAKIATLRSRLFAWITTRSRSESI